MPARQEVHLRHGWLDLGHGEHCGSVRLEDQEVAEFANDDKEPVEPFKLLHQLERLRLLRRGPQRREIRPDDRSVRQPGQESALAAARNQEQARARCALLHAADDWQPDCNRQLGEAGLLDIQPRASHLRAKADDQRRTLGKAPHLANVRGNGQKLRPRRSLAGF